MTPAPAIPRRSLRAIAADRLAERRSFATTSGWLWSLVDRALNRRTNLKLWRGSLKRVRLRGHDRPFFLRLGTSDWLVLKEIFVDGEYQELAKLDPRSIRTILDLGANIGLSVRLWQKMFPGAHIIAVEPDAGNMAVCRANANAAPSPEPAPVLQTCCVGGTRRKVTMDHSGGQWAYKMRDAATGTTTIDALTIPDVLAAARTDAPIDLLKCDIEGAEAELFAHASPWIGRVGVIIVELHEPYTVERFKADLASADPRPWDCRVLYNSKDVAVILARRPA